MTAFDILCVQKWPILNSLTVVKRPVIENYITIEHYMNASLHSFFVSVYSPSIHLTASSHFIIILLYMYYARNIFRRLPEELARKK